ncbi:MAG TPA: hypothetical protein VLC09_07385, partial [Polyangiaceae bacterium]|nr:hypothetical protein [Polyangiaceae bacterium]
MAHPDLEKLLELLLDSARTTLEAAGEFLPFAAIVDAQGRLSLLEAEPPEEDDFDVAVFVEALRHGIRRSIRSGDVLAAGVCANVHAALPNDEGSSDAIVAELERSGEAFDVF